MEILSSFYPILLDWLDLIVRWIHIIVGIAWIGTSFYFNWLDSRLDRKIDNEDIDIMLRTINCLSLDDLIEKTVPSNILFKSKDSQKETITREIVSISNFLYLKL